jgi:hypothetical protein
MGQLLAFEAPERKNPAAPDRTFNRWSKTGQVFVPTNGSRDAPFLSVQPPDQDSAAQQLDPPQHCFGPPSGQSYAAFCPARRLGHVPACHWGRAEENPATPP